jgi:flagellar biosynthesis protein FlhB
MADDRSIAPSPRRLALARRAGFIPRSALLVGAAAWAGAVLGLVIVARRGADAIDAAIRAGADAAAAPSPDLASVSAAGVVGAIVGLLAPLAVGAACGALALHLAQTRALALPRRDVPGAPRAARGLDRRGADAGLRGARAVLVGGTAVVWLWARRADLVDVAALAPAAGLAAAGALAVSALAHLAAALLVAGALDLGVEVLRHRADVKMTRVEAADDARAAGVDPRWRRERTRGEPDAAIKTARLVVTGDGAVAAVRYHPRVWPRPTVVAAGRGLDGTRVLELARRHRVAIAHAPRVARALAGARSGDAIPDAVTAELAELVAATEPAP